MHQPKFTYVTYIAATPEDVWRALTEGEFTRRYFFGRRVKSDWRTGSPVAFFRPDGQVDVEGVVLRSEALRQLSYTWAVPGDATPRQKPTRVTFKLEPLVLTVKLTLIHEDLLAGDYDARADTFRGYNNGWPAILSNLKSMLETGSTLAAIGETDVPRSAASKAV